MGIAVAGIGLEERVLLLTVTHVRVIGGGLVGRGPSPGIHRKQCINNIYNTMIPINN